MTDQTDARRIAYRLSGPMVDALIRGMAGEGSAKVYGHTNTIVALMGRGLITDSRSGHRWTKLGREVARALWPEQVRTLDELHALAIVEDRTRSGLPCRCKPHPVFGHEDACRYVGTGPAAQPEQVTGTAEYGSVPRPPAQQPGKRVISRFGGRGYVVRLGDHTVTLSLNGAPLEISRRKFDEDWWPDTNPRGTVRINEAVLALAYAGFEGGGVRGAVKAAFEAAGLQVIE